MRKLEKSLRNSNIFFGTSFLATIISAIFVYFVKPEEGDAIIAQVVFSFGLVFTIIAFFVRKSVVERIRHYKNIL